MSKKFEAALEAIVSMPKLIETMRILVNKRAELSSNLELYKQRVDADQAVIADAQERLAVMDEQIREGRAYIVEQEKLGNDFLTVG